MIRNAFATLLLLAVPAVFATAQDTPSSLRVYLDCPGEHFMRCDEEFMRSEITLVDFVRDRAESDVQVQVTSEGTGSGGRVWTLAFLGRRGFRALSDTLVYTSNATDSEDVRRRGMTEVVKRGLVRYLARTAMAGDIGLRLVRPETALGESVESIEHDPWDYWVFSLGANPRYNGEESTDRLEVRANLSANRTTEDLKIRASGDINIQRRSFDVSDTTIVSTTRRGSVFGQVVKTVSGQWSAGGFLYWNTSSQNNTDASFTIGPQLEYNFFPYSESTSREFRINYGPMLSREDYEEMTIFGLEAETILHHAIRAHLNIKQRWGSINLGGEFSHLLTNFDRSLTDSYRLRLNGGGNFQLGGGLSFYFGGGWNLIRDQLFLPASGASDEDILLGTVSLPTGYNFNLFAGFNYRFGSIFNNVVNPRLDFD